MRKSKPIKEIRLKEPTEKNTYAIAANDFFDWEVGLDFENRYESAEVFYKELESASLSYHNHMSGVFEKFSAQVFFNPNFWPVTQEYKNKFTNNNWDQIFTSSIEKLKKENLLNKFISSLPYAEWENRRVNQNENIYLAYPKLFSSIFLSKEVNDLLVILFLPKVIDNHLSKREAHFTKNQAIYGSSQEKQPPKEREKINYNLSFSDAISVALEEKRYEKLSLSEEEFKEKIKTLTLLTQAVPQIEKLMTFNKELPIQDFIELAIKNSYVLSLLETSAHQTVWTTSNLYAPKKITKDDILNLLVPKEYIETNKEEILKQYMLVAPSNYYGSYSNSHSFLHNVISGIESPSQTLHMLVNELKTVMNQKRQEKIRLNEALYKDKPLEEISTEFSWSSQEKSSLSTFFNDFFSQHHKSLTLQDYEELKELMLTDKEIYKIFIRQTQYSKEFENLFLTRENVLRVFELLGYESATEFKTKHYEKLKEEDFKRILQSHLRVGVRIDFDNYTQNMKNKKWWKDLVFTVKNKNNAPEAVSSNNYENIAKQTGLFRDHEFVSRMIKEENINAISVALEYKLIRQNESILAAVIEKWPKTAEYNFSLHRDNKLLSDKAFVLKSASKMPAILKHASSELWRDVEFVAQSVNIAQSQETFDIHLFPKYIQSLVETMRSTGQNLEDILKTFEDSPSRSQLSTFKLKP